LAGRIRKYSLPSLVQDGEASCWMMSGTDVPKMAAMRSNHDVGGGRMVGEFKRWGG
jgi:hypothetical protein